MEKAEKTDREVLLDMLKRANIEVQDLGGTELVVTRGYIGFSTTFTFDDDGNLKDMGAYE